MKLPQIALWRFFAATALAGTGIGIARWFLRAMADQEPLHIDVILLIVSSICGCFGASGGVLFRRGVIWGGADWSGTSLDHRQGVRAYALVMKSLQMTERSRIRRQHRFRAIAPMQFTATTTGPDSLGLCQLLERFAAEQWLPAHATREEAAGIVLDLFRRQAAGRPGGNRAEGGPCTARWIMNKYLWIAVGALCGLAVGALVGTPSEISRDPSVGPIVVFLNYCFWVAVGCFFAGTARKWYAGPKK